MSDTIPILPPGVVKLVNEALAIQAEEASERGAIGYMARVLTQTTMPHSKQSNNEFTRKNGHLTLSIMAPREVGLPYGAYPRLLLAWTTTEAVRTKSPILELGPSLAGFMGILGLVPTGGRWGSIPNLRKQMRSLYSSTISYTYGDETLDAIGGIRIAKDVRLWWHPKDPNQAALWSSTVTLSQDFFDEIIDRPVIIDMDALRALKRSPLALDIYCWLTYRMSYLKKATAVPWEVLQMQFGAGYPWDSRGKRNFKSKFIGYLHYILTLYPKVKIEALEHGLLLKPSPPHVKMLSHQS